MNQTLQQLNPSHFKLLHTQNGKCSPLIFVAVITLVCCGITFFFSPYIGPFFYLKNHFSPCIWFQCLAYVSYAHIAPRVGLDTIIGLDNNTAQTLYSYNKNQLFNVEEY